MPIYEYKCSQCNQVFEVFQSIKDSPIKKCKFCAGAVTKLISNCSFQLKGTGWYLTDYARKDANTSGTDKKEEPKPSEKKPAEKPANTKEPKSRAVNT